MNLRRALATTHLRLPASAHARRCRTELASCRTTTAAHASALWSCALLKITGLVSDVPQTGSRTRCATLRGAWPGQAALG